MFYRKSWLEVLVDSEVCYMDGTFKITPPLFYQVFVLLGKHLGQVFPVVYALLPNKTHNTYYRMFRMLKEVEVRFSPTKLSCDFEMGLIKAAQVSICLMYNFCYSPSVWCS